MANKDVRWLQRFANFKKALLQLDKFIDKSDPNELEEQGLIQAFEYTYELAWNVIKDFYEEQAVASIQGRKDAFSLAFNRGLIKDGASWLAMVDDRARTSHTYNEEIAREIVESIREEYVDLFKELQGKLESVQDGKQS